MTEIDDLNVKVQPSEEFQVEIDMTYYDVIKELKEDNPHKHLTSGVGLYEMIGLVSGQVDVDDVFADYEQMINSKLVNYGVDVSLIDSYSIRKQQLTEYDKNQTVKFYLPVSVHEQLPYFKSEFVEDIIKQYYSSYWDSRSERLEFKQELLDYFKNENFNFDNKKFAKVVDELDLNGSDSEWYVGLDAEEIRERAEDNTKETIKDRLPVLQHMFDLQWEYIDEQVLREHQYINIDKFVDNMITDDVSYVMEMFGVSRPTAQRYLDRVDDYWRDYDWLISYLDSQNAIEAIIKNYPGNKIKIDKNSAVNDYILAQFDGFGSQLDLDDCKAKLVKKTSIQGDIVVVKINNSS